MSIEVVLWGTEKWTRDGWTGPEGLTRIVVPRSRRGSLGGRSNSGDEVDPVTSSSFEQKESLNSLSSNKEKGRGKKTTKDRKTSN